MADGTDLVQTGSKRLPAPGDRQMPIDADMRRVQRSGTQPALRHRRAVLHPPSSPLAALPPDSPHPSPVP